MHGSAAVLCSLTVENPPYTIRDMWFYLMWWIDKISTLTRLCGFLREYSTVKWERLAIKPLMIAGGCQVPHLWVASFCSSCFPKWGLHIFFQFHLAVLHFSLNLSLDHKSDLKKLALQRALPLEDILLNAKYLPSLWS